MNNGMAQGGPGTERQRYIFGRLNTRAMGRSPASASGVLRAPSVRQTFAQKTPEEQHKEYLQWLTAKITERRNILNNKPHTPGPATNETWAKPPTAPNTTETTSTRRSCTANTNQTNNYASTYTGAQKNQQKDSEKTPTIDGKNT